MKLRKNEMKVRKNEIKLPKNCSFPRWKVRNPSGKISDFLGGRVTVVGTHDLCVRCIKGLQHPHSGYMSRRSTTDARAVRPYIRYPSALTSKFVPLR